MHLKKKINNHVFFKNNAALQLDYGNFQENSFLWQNLYSTMCYYNSKTQIPWLGQSEKSLQKQMKWAVFINDSDPFIMIRHLEKTFCSKHLSFLSVSSAFCHGSGRPMSRTSHDKIALLLNIYECVLSRIYECGVWVEWVLDDIWRCCTTGNQTCGSATVMVEAPIQIRKTWSLISKCC